ncbi:MAG TPA: SDR family oxidoreductase [Solirubrobacteraceae bacterium]|nr:SDR family oxidoreductase [Solirubrobacteraceae bacterium]
MPTALITGASSGIGQATSLRLARSGWRVLAGVRRSEDGERLASEGPPGRIEALELDVTDPAQVAAAAARVDGSGLGALVNNAGIGVGGPLEVLSEDEWRRQFDVNFFAQIAVTRALLPSLRAARGRIVFISSIGGKVAMAFNGPYAASKHAIEAVGDALRVELARSGVQVALIEPGSVATPIWDKTRGIAQRIEIPAGLEHEYGDIPGKIEKVLQDTGARGIPPEAVAEAIEKALSAPRMPSRVLVGRDARLMATVRRVLPDRVFDGIVRRRLGL